MNQIHGFLKAYHCTKQLHSPVNQSVNFNQNSTTLYMASQQPEWKQSCIIKQDFLPKTNWRKLGITDDDTLNEGSFLR